MAAGGLRGVVRIIDVAHQAYLKPVSSVRRDEIASARLPLTVAAPGQCQSDFVCWQTTGAHGFVMF